MYRGQVSIIIPVYNVESYLEQCLKSVIQQTYENLEIIIVDDESTDSSGEIVDQYAKIDQRIKALHIKNRGAAGARNVGLEVATGDFIFFVDSDDWLELDAVETMVKMQEKYDSDIVVCQYMDEYIGDSKKHSIVENEILYDREQAMGEYLKHWEYPLIWAKLYKKELLRNVRFEEGHCIDDEFFTYQLFAKARNVLIGTDLLYHYRHRKSSAMGNSQKKIQRCRDQVDFVTVRYENLKRQFPNLEARMLEHMCEVYMGVMRQTGKTVEVYRYAKHHLMKYGKKALRKSISFNVKKSIIVYCLKYRVAQQIQVIEQDDNFFR